MSIQLKKGIMKEKGITLVALVVTIIVLLILAGLSIRMVLGENGLIQRAKNSTDTYKQEEQNEIKQLTKTTDYIDELSGQNSLSKEKIAAVINNIKNADTLQEVEYVAKEIKDDVTSIPGKGRKVVVEGEYSGTGEDQTFYQSDLGAIGTGRIKWYVLSADEDGINLVSQATRLSVEFKNSQGYDNCLYYLNELSTKLFTNEDYGVTEQRVHALRLSDIKKASEQVNMEYKVTMNEIERNWSWDLDVIKESNSDAYNNGNVGEKTHIYAAPNKYYPGLYKADLNKEVETKNPFFDEEPGNLNKTDNGISRTLEDESNPASKLTVNYSHFSTSNRNTTLARLGAFGRTCLGEELFESNNRSNCWIASRCIKTNGSYVAYGCRALVFGAIDHYYLCETTQAEPLQTSHFRVVVSIPSSRVNIADDGTVTLVKNNVNHNE